MNDEVLIDRRVAAIETVCALGPVIPVLTINRVEDAVPLAQALVSGGLRTLEVTLRTEVALDALEQIQAAVPEACVGAGTVLNPEDFKRSVAHGSQFIVSPGITEDLLAFAAQQEVPLLPGVQTVSEMMTGIRYGFKRFKLFPAQVCGGVDTLKAYQGPFSDIRFCPTGGIRFETAGQFLELNNVMCVGGTWLTPHHLVESRNWDAIETLARETVAAFGHLSDRT